MQFLSIIGFALLSSVTLASPIAQDDASNIFNTVSNSSTLEANVTYNGVGLMPYPWSRE